MSLISRRLRIWQGVGAIVLIGVVSAGGYVLAQNQDALDVDVELSESAPSESTTPYSEIPADISIESGHVLAKQWLGEMLDAKATLSAQVSSAKEGRDFFKTVCLGAKLSACEAAADAGQTRAANVLSANSTSEMVHELEMLATFRDQSNAAVTGAAECVGISEQTSYSSEVKVNVADNIPETEPTEPSSSSGSATAPPSTVSAAR